MHASEEIFSGLDVPQKKALLEARLNALGRRARADLGRFCDVKDRTVSNWLHPEKGWTKNPRQERKIEAFLVMKEASLSTEKPLSFSPDALPDAALPSSSPVASAEEEGTHYPHLLKSVGIVQEVVTSTVNADIQPRVAAIFEKLTNALETATTLPRGGKEEMLWLDETVPELQHQMGALQELQGQKGLEVLKQVRRELEGRLSYLVTGHERGFT